MEQLDERRQKLLAGKLGNLLGWSVPELEDVIGPYNPSVFHDFRRQLAPLISRCENELRNYTDDEIDILVSKNRSDPGGLRNQWADFADPDVRGVERRQLPWYAGGFGHPDYRADLAYWARMPRFTVEEATCLSVGIDPKHFSSRRLKELSSGDREKLWPSLVFLLERHTQLQRVFGVGQERPVRAPFFADWATRFEFEMHPTFHKLLKRYHGGDAKTGATADETAKPDKREIDKIAQLLTAMAIVEYGYDPDSKRSPIPNEIANLAAEIGLSISPETIRKYLRIGAAHLPKNWKPKTD